jgi:maltose alpha-D-glucosyltransferase/alpha-amylase
LNKTRRLIALHHSEPALANYAEFIPVYPSADAGKPSPSIYPFVYARAAGKDVVLVMLNPRAEASDATFPINVKFKKTRLLAGDRFPMEHNKKTGNMTIHMPATSYAIVKLL